MISKPMRTVAVLLFSAAAAFADGQVAFELPLVNTIEPGVRAAGMGGAFRAVADDFSAMYYNPAGLAQVTRFELSTSLLHYRHGTDATVNGCSTVLEHQSTRFGNLGLVMPYPVYRGALVFGAGFVRTQADGAVAGFESYRGDTLWASKTAVPTGTLGRLSLAAAVGITPSVSGGAAVDIISGSGDREESGAFFDTSSGIHLYYDDLTDLGYVGVNMTFGLLIRTGAHLAWGLTATTPTLLSEEGEVRYELDDDPLFSSPDAETEVLDNTLLLPMKLGAGAAWYAPWFLLSADAEYVDWEQMRYNGRFYGEHRETVNLAAGAEVLVPGTGLKLRAGYAHKPVVFSYALSVPEERRTVTCGAGFLVDTDVMVDVAYTYRFWTEVNTQYSSPVESEHAGGLVQLGVAYRF